MDLGAFSISLSVKDIEKSKVFYEKMGFKAIGGDIAQNWLIMKNSSHVIGLFQGIFEKNTLTFNPGWSQDSDPLEAFTDVRTIQKQLISAGLELATEADDTTLGPASLMLFDPDGNPILIDQHV